MATEIRPVVIEISEEAYKQNTVYRPWSEIEASNPAAEPRIPPGQLRPLRDPFIPQLYPDNSPSTGAQGL